MKNIIILSVLLGWSYIYANLSFNTCAGSGTFEAKIHKFNHFNDSTLVGKIPVGIEGLKISLISDNDVDIRLYGENEDKIVHWPYGIHHFSMMTTKPYKDVPFTYSGYNGVDGDKGHEFIEVLGKTPTELTMKAFGYNAGYARVNYSWTGKEGCNSQTSGEGNFTQNLEKNKTSLVGTISSGVTNVKINLYADKDLDIQLFGQDGTAIVLWKPAGIMSGATLQNIMYHDMNITWSGYNGVNGKAGHEYITISNKTSEMLVLKVYGYEEDEATVSYAWGDTNKTLWRTRYLDQAQQRLKEQYVERYQEVFPEETYTWVKEHGYKNALLQATEIDPRIVKNIDLMLKQLDQNITEQYANIIFGIAVARRVYGLESVDFTNNRFSKPLEVAKKLTKAEKEKKRIQDEFVTEVENFMQTKGWDFNQTIDNMPMVLEHITAYGNAHGYKPSKFFANVKYVGIYLHMLKIKNTDIHFRQSYATGVEYIHFIASIRNQMVAPFIKKDENISWPNIFSDTAKWPLYMPLAEMRPMDEMQWVWNRFKDESVSPLLRLRSYGNYRKDPEVLAPLLASVDYEKGSVQYSNYVGGVCGTMSSIARATYISLGIPSIGMGQPKHAALIRYIVDENNNYMILLEQSISTLYNSTPDWYFFEDSSFRMNSISNTNGEYQSGLALAMNEPMQNYLDSRTFVRLAKKSTAKEKENLLKKATDASVFNAEAWYQRFEAMGKTTVGAQILVDELIAKLPNQSDGYTDPKLPDVDLEGEVVHTSLNREIGTYRDTVIAAIILELFRNHYNQNFALEDSYIHWIKELNTKNLYDLKKLYSFESYAASGEKLKYLAGDIKRDQELKRQKRMGDLQIKIDNNMEKILVKQAKIDTGKLSDKNVEKYKNQIKDIQSDINKKEIEREALQKLSVLYWEDVYGDGIDEDKIF